MGVTWGPSYMISIYYGGLFRVLWCPGGVVGVVLSGCVCISLLYPPVGGFPHLVSLRLLLSFMLGSCMLSCLSNMFERSMNVINLFIPLKVPVSLPHWVSSVSECMSVSVVRFAFQCDMLSGLDCSSAWAFDCLGWYEALIVFSGVCMSSSALDQPAERFPFC